MKSKNAIPVLALIGALITAGSALQAGKKWASSYQQSMGSVVQAQQALQERQAALQSAQELAAQDGESPLPGNRSEVFTEALLALKAASSAGGISSPSISAAGTATSGEEVAVETLFKPMPLTGGKIITLTLNVKGGYNDYQSFRHFLRSASAIPASVRCMKVAESSFDMDLQLYAVQ